MDVINKKKTFLFIILICSFLTSACQIGYLAKSAYYQMKILNNREPISDALQRNDLTEDEKNKLILSREVTEFAEKELGLNVKKNYTTFVKLEQPFVSYVVSASPKNLLKAHLWWFPIIGSVPYKGYYNESDAQAEAESLKAQNLDVYLRGVSAYSTLGWFKDPILSSMLKYKNYDLVNTIIHESVHATLYIKSEADFNERFATFLGNKGMELFYQKKEGPESPTLKEIYKENEDDQLFSKFISKELVDLETWYTENKDDANNIDIRTKRLNKIKNQFETDILPNLKTATWKSFAKNELNNARLIIYKTYFQDLNDFQNLYEKNNSDFKKFLELCKNFEKSNNPNEALKDLLKNKN